MELEPGGLLSSYGQPKASKERFTFQNQSRAEYVFWAFLNSFFLFLFLFFQDNIKKLKRPDRLVYNNGAAAVTVCVSTCLAKGRETLAGAHSAAEDNKGHFKRLSAPPWANYSRARLCTLPAAKCSRRVCFHWVCCLKNASGRCALSGVKRLHQPCFTFLMETRWRCKWLQRRSTSSWKVEVSVRVRNGRRL